MSYHAADILCRSDCICTQFLLNRDKMPASVVECLWEPDSASFVRRCWPVSLRDLLSLGESTKDCLNIIKVLGAIEPYSKIIASSQSCDSRLSKDP